MEIETTRFGRLEVDEERIIVCPEGLLGFPSKKRWALIQSGEDNYFFWLQAVDEPSLAFVVTDPAFFRPEYRVGLEPMRTEDLAALTYSLRIEGSLANAQVFVICNRSDEMLTANYAGPLIVNAKS